MTFEVSRGDGLLGDPGENRRSITLLTDAEGKAQITFQLGSRTGQGFHRVRVTTPGSLTFAEFCATAVPSAPANIAVVMAPPVQSQVNVPLTERLAAIVTDGGGNSVGGVAVTFSVDAGDGNLSGLPSVTVNTDMDRRSAVIRALASCSRAGIA